MSSSPGSEALDTMQEFCDRMAQRDPEVLRPLLADDAVYLDMIRTPSGVQGVPVMGAFVVREGKISRWHDYWDTSLPMKMMTGEDVAPLVPRWY